MSSKAVNHRRADKTMPKRIKTNNDLQKTAVGDKPPKKKTALVVYVQLGELNIHLTLRMDSK